MAVHLRRRLFARGGGPRGHDPGGGCGKRAAVPTLLEDYGSQLGHRGPSPGETAARFVGDRAGCQEQGGVAPVGERTALDTTTCWKE